MLKTPLKMKTSINDQYLFSQLSTSGKAGFECFKNQTSKKYYFHFNDENGHALIYSQAYSSIKSRDAGMKSLQKNLAIASRYGLKREDKKHFFIVKAGNHQEIGRSRPFHHKKDMLVAIEYAQAFLGQAKTNFEKLKTKTRSTKKTSTSLPNPSKHAFRIELYPQKNQEENIQGRIVHIVSKDQETFDHLDGDIFLKFIRRKLQLPAVAAIPISEAEAIPVSRTFASQMQLAPSAPAAEVKEREVDLAYYAERIAIKVSMPKVAKRLYNTDTEATKVSINIPSNIVQNAVVYKAILQLNSIKEAQMQVLCMQYQNLIPEGETLVFPLSLGHLVEGMYRLKIEMQFGKDYTDLQDKERLNASTVIVVN